MQWTNETSDLSGNGRNLGIEFMIWSEVKMSDLNVSEPWSWADRENIETGVERETKDVIWG